MRRGSTARPWLSVTGGVAGLVGVALLALVLGYLLPLLRGVGVLEGASLPSQPLGRLLFAEQMAREFDCQGVQHTRHGTWLVASQNDAGYAVDLPHDEAPPLALESLLPQPPQNTAAFAARRARSFVSRLDEQGVFRLLASVPATACLLASTADDTLWLLTDLPRPANSPVEQTVIFRSLDQGRTWHWLERGLFPGVSAFALDLAPQQVGQALWQWGDAMSMSMRHATAELMAEMGGEQPEAFSVPLYYSPDAGETVEQLALPDELFVDEAYARSRLPAGAQLASAGYDDIRLYTVPLASDRAVAWVSQRFPYSYPDEPYIRGGVALSSALPVQRQDGRWQVQALRRYEGVFIERLAQAEGRRLAILGENSLMGEAQLVELTASGLDWRTLSALPRPFADLPAHNGVASLQVGKRAIVLGMRASHQVPRWLQPWRRQAASISGGGDYLSLDGGMSWTRVALPYVLGHVANSDQLVASDAPWFSSRDLTLRQITLAPEQ